ncbi:unnamed protein product [Albugo candida]|uniref:Uncharacterized protein n=1 Tax=Albugo candida TaxID=65357 RepID=A0A024GBW4_9STRA|nr:unnamed protein product [Albugo candida]|eukprot:CCI44164.1 unnamed protein product [Albugo candida]
MPGNLVLVSSRTPTEDDCNELVEALTEYETACQKIIADEEICTRVHEAFNDGIKKRNFMMTETTKLGHIITYYYKTCIVISIDKGPTFTITEEQRFLFETPEGQRIAISNDQLLEMETSSGFLLQMKLIKSLTSENVYKLPLIPKTLFEDIRSDLRSIKGTDLEGASPSGRKSHGETAMRHV